MNKLIKITAIAIVSIFFTACGDDSSTSVVDNNDYGTNERMITDKTYTINSGDEIEKISEDPTIEVVTNLETGVTTAKLISGEAAIIRH